MKSKALILFIPALIICIPLGLLLSGSFMGVEEVIEKVGPVLMENRSGFAQFFLLPQYPTLRPYIELLLDTPEFFIMFWNSVKMVVPILIGQILVSVPAAWGFAKFQFKGRKLLFSLYIVLMLMPFQVTMVSNYLVLDSLNLLDTRLAVILPAIFSTFPVFIIYRFFRGIPKEFLEAAAVDGANPFQAFIHIGIPMGIPGIAAAMMLTFLEYWNMIEQPLTFIKDKALWPLSLFSPGGAENEVSVALAASIIILIPPLIIFLLGQKYLEAGIKAAGLKG